MYTGTKRDQTKEGVNCSTMTKPDDNGEQFCLITTDAQSWKPLVKWCDTIAQTLRSIIPDFKCWGFEWILWQSARCECYKWINTNRMQMEKEGEGKSVLNQNFWSRTHLRDTPHWLLWLLHMIAVVYNTQKASQLLFEFSLLILLEKFCMNLTGLQSL